MNLPEIDESRIAEQLQQSEQSREMEQKRQALLERVCHRAALERLARIKLVKRPVAEKVENMIVSALRCPPFAARSCTTDAAFEQKKQAMATTGRLKSQVTEADMVKFLRDQETTETSVVFVRKGKRLDDDDDNDDDADFR